jgi:hypothetical protein
MRRILTGIAVGILGLVVLPAFAVDKDDKDKKDPVPDVKKADDPKKADDVKKADDAKKADDLKKADDAKKADDLKKADDAKKAEDAKKADAKKDDKKDAPKKDDSEKMIITGTVAGKLVEVNETKKSIRVQMTIQIQKPNPAAMQAAAAAQIQYQQAIARRDANGARVAALNMAQNKAQSMTTESKTQDVEVTGTEDVKIRQTNPPIAYNDKGRPMKRSAKELKELKGDLKLPGYPGEFTDLHTDQIVKVTLVKKKETPVHKGPKAKDKDADAESLDKLPETNLIEIVAEPSK